MPVFKQNYDIDFVEVQSALREGEPFALSRFNDGEHAILTGKPYRAASGWTTTKKKEPWIKPLLLASLEANMPGYCVGISPPCCLPSKTVRLYYKHAKVPQAQITFSTLFFNSNYMKALRMFQGSRAILVACKNADIKIPHTGVNTPWNIDKVVDQLVKEADRPIFVAAGPCSCIIIHRYWKRVQAGEAEPQIIIDIGATLDVVIHGAKTRRYHDPRSRLRAHKCSWQTRVTSSGMAPRAHEIRGEVDEAAKDTVDLEAYKKARRARKMKRGEGKWMRQKVRRT